MKIAELFRRLSFGELSNLALSFDGTGDIVDGKQEMLVNHTNEALLRLFSRFILLEKDVIIEMSGNRTSYPLLARYAELNVSSPETPEHRFIKDGLHTPFTDDVIKILSVYDYVGAKFPLNDVEHPFSMFTPSPNTLQVPVPHNKVALSVTYQARHPLIDPAASLDQEIDIPFTMEGALQSYIAHLVYSHMNGQENLVKSQECEAKYEKICLDIEDKDLGNQTFQTSNVRFEKRGWK
jgi:hypothetical protein